MFKLNATPKKKTQSDEPIDTIYWVLFELANANFINQNATLQFHGNTQYT